MKDIVSQDRTSKLKPNFEHGSTFIYITLKPADGTDHIDPAQLRGLGPDQVLVLVNGKEGTPLH
jgi:iron complex outermembrane receptor protein